MAGREGDVAPQINTPIPAARKTAERQRGLAKSDSSAKASVAEVPPEAPRALAEENSDPAPVTDDPPPKRRGFFAYSPWMLGLLVTTGIAVGLFVGVAALAKQHPPDPVTTASTEAPSVASAPTALTTAESTTLVTTATAPSSFVAPTATQATSPTAPRASSPATTARPSASVTSTTASTGVVPTGTSSVPPETNWLKPK